MARVKGPLLSNSASGNFGGVIQFRGKGGGTPGGADGERQCARLFKLCICLDALFTRMDAAYDALKLGIVKAAVRLFAHYG